jgi:hypothetical protein
MAITIHLPGTGADLILRTDEKTGWCLCYISNRGEHLIGGQPANYVIHHLLEAFVDPQAKPAGEIQEHPVSWVMSLASPHISVYCAEVDQDRWLFFQNAEAIIIRIVILNVEQQAQWKNELQQAVVMGNSSGSE